MSLIKSFWVILFNEMDIIHCENCTQHTNILGIKMHNLSMEVHLIADCSGRVVYGTSLAGIVGSSPVDGLDVSIL